MGRARNDDWRLTSCLRILVSVLIVSTIAAADEPPGAKPDDRPPADPVPLGPDSRAVDGLPQLKLLYEGGRLRLSNDDDSSAESFYYGLSAFVRAPPGQPDRNDIGVWRDRDKLLVWSWSRVGKNSVACCAITDGLFVGLDPKHPGGLVLFEGGHPEVVFAGAPDGQGAEFQYRYRPAGAEAARVVFDARSLIQSTFPRMLSASRDEQRKTIKVRTQRAMLEVKPAEPPHAAPAANAPVPAPAPAQPFPVEWLMVTGPRQAVAFHIPAKAFDPPPTVENLTADAVKGLGLPVRELKAGDDAEFRPYFDVPVADFCTDPRHRQAADKLWGLLHIREKPRFDPKLAF